MFSSGEHHAKWDVRNKFKKRCVAKNFILTFSHRGFGGKDKKTFGKPEPVVYTTEDGGLETEKAAAIIALGVVIFPAIVPVPVPAALLMAHVRPVSSQASTTRTRCLQIVFIYHSTICVCLGRMRL